MAVFQRIPVIRARVVESPNPDYTFDISYCGITKRGGTQSYYSVSAPFSTGLIDALSVDSQIYISSDGSTLDFFNVDSFEYSIGPRSSSITITGSRQEAAAGPFLFIIKPEDVISQTTDSSGRISLQIVPFSYPFLTPGNLVNYGAVTKTLELYDLELSPDGPSQILVLAV